MEWRWAHTHGDNHSELNLGCLSGDAEPSNSPCLHPATSLICYQETSDWLGSSKLHLMINLHKASGEEEGIRTCRCTGVREVFPTYVKAFFLLKAIAELKDITVQLNFNFYSQGKSSAQTLAPASLLTSRVLGKSPHFRTLDSLWWLVPVISWLCLSPGSSPVSCTWK